MSVYFFPTPYKDELLYSVLARYCVQSGHINDIHNIDDLYGTRNIVASVELPGKMDLLISNLPKNSLYNSKNLILMNTLYPYIGSFLPKERAIEIIELMKEGQVSNIYTKSGFISGHINQNMIFRFCPECMKEDVKMYGETYWHRLHQITGVFVCPVHKQALQNSSIEMRGVNRQCYVAASVDNCIPSDIEPFSEDIIEKLYYISRVIHTILQRDFILQDIVRHKFLIVDKLIQLKYASLNGMVHQKILRKGLLDYWGAEVLSLLQCPISIDEECTWLASLVRENNIPSQPIRYILLSIFLNIDINDLLGTSFISTKFTNHKDIWEEQLKVLVQTKKSLREMALILNSTSKTIKKSIIKLGIEPYWVDRGGRRYKYIPYKETDEFNERRIKARDQWLELQSNNKSLSRNKLKRLDETLYTWIYNNDREWLVINSPTIKFTRNQYWEKKDKEVLNEVKNVINMLDNRKPERITWTYIENTINKSGWLSKNKDKLPLVKEYIESHIETLEAYHIRKINWAIEDLKQENKSLTKWNIIEKSGVKERYINRDNNPYI